jgi:CheY-like chemotaxis protein
MVEQEALMPTQEMSGNLAHTILVIDDEAPVRDAASDILTDRGFVVMTANGGEEGIAALCCQGTRIGMVLLDLKMPGMNGAETYRRLRQIEPTIKVIFTSGYSESELSTDVHNAEGVDFLAKPYSAESLAEHVHKMMALN